MSCTCTLIIQTPKLTITTDGYTCTASIANKIYLMTSTDICSLSEEDLSCLWVSILSCQRESCGTILTRGDGGGERCDGERTVHV